MGSFFRVLWATLPFILCIIASELGSDLKSTEELADDTVVVEGKFLCR